MIYHIQIATGIFVKTKNNNKTEIFMYGSREQEMIEWAKQLINVGIP